MNPTHVPSGFGLRFQKFAAGFLGDGLAHFQLRQFGHGGFAVCGIGQGGKVGALDGRLLFEDDLFGQDASLGHDAKACGVAGGYTGVARGSGRGLP